MKKQITVLLTGGMPMRFLLPVDQVPHFRESVTKRLVYVFEDTAVNGQHVMAYVVQDPKEAEEDEENDCNS